uniref:CHHC U11-48K-type domain-containing protein n=1 Tax=Gopherus agassizii TaxID=38772 RepID=A0A452J341_9SAUR
MDPERLIPCPYDKNHQIRASRFPYHLVKCGENNKKRAKELATCPYNARHKVPKQELQLHISTCTDNQEPELFSGKLRGGGEVQGVHACFNTCLLLLTDLTCPGLGRLV